jgi:hypothetical protein
MLDVLLTTLMRFGCCSMAGMTLVVVDCYSSPSCEDFSGYKKMRMESPVSKLQRKTPLKQVSGSRTARQKTHQPV